jgi:hypothetical protein
MSVTSGARPVVTVVALSFLFGAAASRAAEPEAPAAAPAQAGAPESKKVVGPPEVAWKDMTGEQRGRWMKVMVTPKMKTIFQEFDSKTFAKFDCTSCHGKDPRARKFKMPNADITPLPPTPAAFQAMMQKKPTWPKWTKFMGEKVEPQMAALLGMPAFDPKKPDPNAFGCRGCHTVSKE